MRVSIGIAAIVGLLGASAPLSVGYAAADTSVHVAADGDDAADGSAEAPFRTVQHAVDVAQPGTTIEVHKGTYQEQVTVDATSGTADAPITVKEAGDGPVTLTANLDAVPCDSTQPAGQRTLMFAGGVDDWRVEGLTIDGGVGILGEGGDAAFKWLDKHADDGDWKTRRKVPAHGTGPEEDEVPDVAGYLADQTGTKLDPSTGIALTGNEITGRGVWTVLATQSQLHDNTIEDIDCGTGPGVWINTYSDMWEVTDNTVAKVAESTHGHYMQEGIRFGGASSYGTISGNKVSHLPGDGRAYTTDVDASFNTFADNTASKVGTGYNEQMASWGNVWKNNQVDGFRSYGFAVRMKDSRHTEPSYNSTSYRATFECNKAAGGPVALGMGTAVRDTFEGNAFTEVSLSKNLRRYWKDKGNTYDGSSEPPPSNPKVATSSC